MILALTHSQIVESLIEKSISNSYIESSVHPVYGTQRVLISVIRILFLKT
jgi:hypothetical protein